MRDELTMSKARVRTRDSSLLQVKRELAELRQSMSQEAIDSKAESEMLRERSKSLEGQLAAARSDSESKSKALGESKRGAVVSTRRLEALVREASESVDRREQAESEADGLRSALAEAESKEEAERQHVVELLERVGTLQEA